MAKHYPPFGGLVGSSDPFPLIDPDAVAVPITTPLPIPVKPKFNGMQVDDGQPTLELILTQLGPIGQNIAAADQTKINEVISQHENILWAYLLLLDQLKKLYT